MLNFCKINTHCTVVTFLMYLGLKVTTWVLVDIISNSLSNIIKCTMTRYYKQKYLRFSSKNTSKIMKKRFFGSNRVWTGDLEIMKPACKQKATETCYYKVLLFHWCDHNSLIAVVFCRFLYFLLPTQDSQWKNSQEFHVATWFSLKMAKSGWKFCFWLLI